jgi:plastocyanin
MPLLLVDLLVPMARAGAVAGQSCHPRFRVVPMPGLDLQGGALDSMSADAPNDAWAVSAFTHRAVSEHWNGTAWRVEPTPLLSDGSQLYGVVALSKRDAWAVGFRGFGVGQETPLIEHWNGASWSVINGAPVSPGQLTSVDAASASDAWAVGVLFTDTGSAVLTEHWDGSSWTAVGAPSPRRYNGIEDVVVLGPDDAWAVGSTSARFRTRLLVEHWDGASWSVVSVPDPSPGGSWLYSIVATGPDDIWASGNSDSGMLLEHWDGASWSVVPWLGQANAIGDIAAAGPRDVWAYGGVLSDGRIEELFGHWNGFKWSSVPRSSQIKRGSPGAIAATTSSVWVAEGASRKGTNAPVWMQQRVCPVQVRDAGFSPTTIRVQQGATVYWSILGKDIRAHRIVDGSGMRLFAYPLVPGGAPLPHPFTYSFVGAGTYPVLDTENHQRATVTVPLRASPRSGGLTTQFTITTAAAAAPLGHAFQTQVKRPATATFQTIWSRGPIHMFIPDAGPGTYEFRARMVDLENEHAAGWSSVTAISVT